MRFGVFIIHSSMLYTHHLTDVTSCNGHTALLKTVWKVCKIIRSWDSSDRDCLNCVLLWSLTDDNLKIEPKKRKSCIIYPIEAKTTYFFYPPVIQGPKSIVCKTMSSAYFFYPKDKFILLFYCTHYLVVLSSTTIEVSTYKVVPKWPWKVVAFTSRNNRKGSSRFWTPKTSCMYNRNVYCTRTLSHTFILDLHSHPDIFLPSSSFRQLTQHRAICWSFGSLSIGPWILLSTGRAWNVQSLM